MKNHQNRTHGYRKTDWWSTEAEGWAWLILRKVVKRCKLTVSKINESWACNVQHREYSYPHDTVYLQVAKGVDLKSSYHTQKFVTVWS